MGEEAAIADVLGGFTPLGEDHPKAQETVDSVRAMLEARAAGHDEVLTELVAADTGTVIRPGNTVVFSTDQPISAADVDALKRQLAEALPGVRPVILSGLRVEAIYRGDDDDG